MEFHSAAGKVPEKAFPASHLQVRQEAIGIGDVSTILCPACLSGRGAPLVSIMLAACICHGLLALCHTTKVCSVLRVCLLRVYTAGIVWLAALGVLHSITSQTARLCLRHVLLSTAPA